ncbi:hypothetical protein K439DRAFT_1409405 [Ramaria rubella]|nr:hypothetical protein K439DRAFT_1409405 [Ramaria rubella]
MVDAHDLPNVELPYRIAKCTGYSGKYVPEHILVDTPMDQTSRWSGAQEPSNSKQWIILEATGSSIVRCITFGKFHKVHPCNMKGFKIYTGRTIDSLTLALDGALSNDPIPETFDLQSTNKSYPPCPIRFVKIVPLSAHSPSFHTSIWHVTLWGIKESSVVEHAEDAYASYRETTALRHVLKYLRQRRHFSSFRALQLQTGIMLEHPIVAKIYDHLVSGDWTSVESLLQTAANNKLFDDCIQACEPKTSWYRLSGANPDGDVPSSRGGHQMCIDSESGVIYLFGGWDGQKNLDDMWAYSISEGRWKMLSFNTAFDGGPGPRSCHKMVFDPLLGYIYLLGRHVDEEVPSSSGTVTPTHSHESSSAPVADTATNPPSQGLSNTTDNGVKNGSKRFPSDFYRYTTRGQNAGTWTVLSEDTGLEGGPPLIFDHQMAIDSEMQMLYIFGGRIVGSKPNAGNGFSGLYRYDIATGKWEHISDESAPSAKLSRGIPSRFGHSMIFDPRHRRLIIFAGKRSESFLADMYIYDVTAGEVTDVTSDFSTAGGPDPCFCQRAALDPDTGHIYVLPGLLKPKGPKKSTADGALRSTFWILNPDTLQWIQVINSRSNSLEVGSTEDAELEPRPRYAHQMVYDHVRREFFVHGGNSGKDGQKRLDDFWSMKFERPSREEIVRRAKFIIRRQHFKELCETIPAVQALTFLQRDVHSVVDHLSDEETATFRALHSHLFDKASCHSTSKGSLPGDVEMTNIEGEAIVRFGGRRSMPGIPELNKDGEEAEAHSELTSERFRQRTLVFESLLGLINANAKQPNTDLLDLVVAPDTQPL